MRRELGGKILSRLPNIVMRRVARFLEQVVHCGEPSWIGRGSILQAMVRTAFLMTGSHVARIRGSRVLRCAGRLLR